MTSAQLQKILGDNIRAVNEMGDSKAERALVVEKADVIVKLAKQLINNTQVILQADKMIKDGKLSYEDIAKYTELPLSEVEELAGSKSA